ncbi:transmembrane protein, putative [Medicago truncatula]|uniref:Transmembrane protein, putative n=1 Tax=Medicago truncatula TaxID=3880 RepID=Q2HU70_MEDTR|nr:hypothetical protein MtrDRAFT_AC149208g30v2 [Medicago truncatula]AES78454.1 transmembrane protein, putative [Medicago truncatula]
MGGFVPYTTLFLVRVSVCPNRWLFQLVLMVVVVMAAPMSAIGGVGFAFLFD